jgi:hypothetical protein
MTDHGLGRGLGTVERQDPSRDKAAHERHLHGMGRLHLSSHPPDRMPHRDTFPRQLTQTIELYHHRQASRRRKVPRRRVERIETTGGESRTNDQANLGTLGVATRR